MAYYVKKISDGSIKRLIDYNEYVRLLNTREYRECTSTDMRDKPKYLEGETKWYKVESSNINSIKYSNKTNTLFIKFGQPQALSEYTYKNVDPQLFEAFLNAPSKGTFFWENIRNNPEFPYIRSW